MFSFSFRKKKKYKLIKKKTKNIWNLISHMKYYCLKLSLDWIKLITFLTQMYNKLLNRRGLLCIFVCIDPWKVKWCYPRINYNTINLDCFFFFSCNGINIIYINILCKKWNNYENNIVNHGNYTFA